MLRFEAAYTKFWMWNLSKDSFSATHTQTRVYLFCACVCVLQTPELTVCE